MSGNISYLKSSLICIIYWGQTQQISSMLANLKFKLLAYNLVQVLINLYLFNLKINLYYF